jgi:hypothetical protein
VGVLLVLDKRLICLTYQAPLLFSQNKSAINNQPVVFFSQNKSAPAISQQPNKQTEKDMTFGK